jgi:hypothetical protein
VSEVAPVNCSVGGVWRISEKSKVTPIVSCRNRPVAPKSLQPLIMAANSGAVLSSISSAQALEATIRAPSTR